MIFKVSDNQYSRPQHSDSWAICLEICHNALDWLGYSSCEFFVVSVWKCGLSTLWLLAGV